MAINTDKLKCQHLDGRTLMKAIIDETKINNEKLRVCANDDKPHMFNKELKLSHNKVLYECTRCGATVDYNEKKIYNLGILHAYGKYPENY